MNDWNAIQRNIRNSGHFAGQTGADEDVFFEFFAGSRRSSPATIFGRLTFNLRKKPSSRVSGLAGIRTGGPIEARMS